MRLLLILVVALLSLGLASAQHRNRCDGEGAPALGIIELGVYPHVYYVDDRNYLVGNGIWAYEETNGVYDDVDGHLQRGGSLEWMLGDNDTCFDHGDWVSDRRIL